MYMCDYFMTRAQKGKKQTWGQCSAHAFRFSVSYSIYASDFKLVGIAFNWQQSVRATNSLYRRRSAGTYAGQRAMSAIAILDWCSSVFIYTRHTRWFRQFNRQRHLHFGACKRKMNGCPTTAKNNTIKSASALQKSGRVDTLGIPVILCSTNGNTVLLHELIIQTLKMVLLKWVSVYVD